MARCLDFVLYPALRTPSVICFGLLGALELRRNFVMWSLNDPARTPRALPEGRERGPVIVCSLTAAIAFSTLLISDCRPANREASAARCFLSRCNKVLAEGVVPPRAAVVRRGRAPCTFALRALRAPDFLRLDDDLPMKCPPNYLDLSITI